MKKYYLIVFICIVCYSSLFATDDDIRYVDLALPSGILWADRNEPCLYTFDESAKQFSNREMPSMEAFQELVDNCTWKWNGNGYTVIGTNGDSIVLPKVPTKDCIGNMMNEPWRDGYYWSVEAYDTLEGWGLCFDENKIRTNWSFARCQAFPVRKIQYPKREFQIPDYEGIQAIGKDSYKALYQRFLAQDTTLSRYDIQALYFGSAFYGYLPEGLDMKKVNSTFEKSGCRGLGKLLDKYLETSPFDLNAIIYRMSAAQACEDSLSLEKHAWGFYRLIDAIAATGDAESPQTAMHIVCVSDEYACLNYLMQVQVDQQTLLTSCHDMFDVTTKSGRKMQIYFDIQLVLALEHQMFSTDTKPFHFVYKPNDKTSK